METATTSVTDPPAQAVEFPRRYIIAPMPAYFEVPMPDRPIFAVYDLNASGSHLFDHWITEQLKEHGEDCAQLADVDRSRWLLQERWRVIGELQEQCISLPIFRENCVAQSVAATLNEEAMRHATKP